jgi:diguanylate cyclase (GGDEF)-like protein
MIAHARRNNQILALLLIDINRFKVMNETLGFNIGDTILVNTAQRLKEILREVDGVFRLGNDEFAIVLEEVSKMEDAAKVAKKILSVINNPYKLASYKEDLFISVSIGISLFPQDGTNGENLIKNAEAAMYQAKEIEQNNFQLYSPTMNARAFEHMTLEHRLHKASEQKEFTLYYQPIVDIKTKRIVAAEALIRWNHPELGLVSPATFIPIAEETGLIIPIGDYIMAVSCDKLKFWHTIGHSDIYISVNLSARQFQQHDLIEKIETILFHCELDPKYLKLEITESISMKNAEETIGTLSKLKERGIQISIDDFGTGYSSLGYLKKFPIDTLKVDQSFIRDIGEDPDCEAIISLIISMAHTLKLKVVAEGVETRKQLDFLKEKNCDLLQGYLFSKPLPENEFEILLEDNNNSYGKNPLG